MSPIKDFDLSYQAVNKDATFSPGDTITGTVTFSLNEDTKVKKVVVKAEGQAHVRFRKGTGDRRKTHFATRRYFKVKKYHVEEKDGGTVLPKGHHHFNFSLKIPQGDVPPSFKGFHGNITYMLQAKISRSWHVPSITKKPFKLLSNFSRYADRAMSPQHLSMNQGKSTISATVDRMACSPGDTISIVAKVSSSKTVKPKFKLVQIMKYFAVGASDTTLQTLIKMAGDEVKPGSTETVSCQLRVPHNAEYTIQNCDIIRVEHRLKVYLDISWAVDPEVEFPLVIIPSRPARTQFGEAKGPYPHGVAGEPSYSDFPPPTFVTGFYSPPTVSSTTHYPAPDPSQLAGTSSYYNQWPQPAPPYGYPNAAFVPPSVQPPGPVAPPQFQQGEQPPSYASIYPPFPNTDEGSGSNHKL
ncbi:arrestin domain-containing protein 3-like [Pholidichthys leucotaenia]